MNHHVELKFNSERIHSRRLVLDPLEISDHPFIFELVNTPGWLKYIGDRQVYSVAEGQIHTLKLLSDPTTRYWTVKRASDQIRIGVVTLIKRDQLADPDIGFAFLPHYQGSGFAFEAVEALITNLQQRHGIVHLLAIVDPTNIRSISLLRKLGFFTAGEFEKNGLILKVFENRKPFEPENETN